jgi:hypothetical protein
MMGGLNYEAEISAGSAELECVFGRYTIEVYTDGVRLNSTTVDLFMNQTLSMVCKYYGLNISVQVIDYFGQPIPNAAVLVDQGSLAPLSKETGADGLAVLNNIIGGDVKVSVTVGGETLPCLEAVYYIDSSSNIPIRLEKYVVLAGSLVETSYVATAVVIVAAIVLILLIELFRRRRLSGKSTD